LLVENKKREKRGEGSGAVKGGNNFGDRLLYASDEKRRALAIQEVPTERGIRSGEG